jgi:hypothetical protein
MAVRLASLLGAVFLAAQLISGPTAAYAGSAAPPGLPAAAAQALGVMETSPAKVAGIASYRVRLWNGGTVYAVPGGDKAIVAILKSKSWDPANSVLFRSGPYIILAPSFLDVPNAVLVPGKQAGLEAVDPDPIICADPTIPGPRFC